MDTAVRCDFIYPAAATVVHENEWILEYDAPFDVDFGFNQRLF